MLDRDPEPHYDEVPASSTVAVTGEASVDHQSSAVPSEDETTIRDAETLFRRVLAEYATWLRRAVRRFCPTDMGIQYEDVEQEVAIRLWRAIRDRRTIEHPTAYIYRAAATATIDAMRRVRTRRETALRLVGSDADDEATAVNHPRDENPTPERAFAQTETLERVQAALESLPDDPRRAVGLYLQGFRSSEIAELLGWTEAKARNLVHRTLKKIRERLHAAGIDYADE